MNATNEPTVKAQATMSEHDRVNLLPQTDQLKALMTTIRDSTTSRSDFVFYSNRIIRLLVEEGLNYLPVTARCVTTSTNSSYQGVAFQGSICGVSIVRAGEAMEQGLRDCCRSVRLGKILIQRDENTGKANLYYSKLPEDIAQRWVFLLDPMLATGGSAIKAVRVLLDRGVPEERIIFLNLISAPEGIATFKSLFPKLRLVTAAIDERLDESRFIVPGLGDFGDRYYSG